MKLLNTISKAVILCTAIYLVQLNAQDLGVEFEDFILNEGLSWVEFDESLYMGQMSSGGREGSSAIKVQFLKNDAGTIDQTYVNALNRFINYEKQFGRLQNAIFRSSRNGQINFCLDFKDVATSRNAMKTLSRMTWIGIDNGEAISLDIEPSCTSATSLSTFTGNQIGSLNQLGTGLTMTCTHSGNNGYQAILELTEQIDVDENQYALDGISIHMFLKQSSPEARYAPIEDNSQATGLLTSNTRSFTMVYSGQDYLDLKFWPAFLVTDVDYYATLLVKGQPQPMFMNCISQK